MSDESKLSNEVKATATSLPPMNLQETQKQLSQTIYDLGRAKYEQYIAESSVNALQARVNALQARTSDLAQQMNRLNEMIQKEVQSKIAEGKPALAVAPSPAPTEGK